MISNHDLTEMFELLISMWTALVLVTKTARIHQGFDAAGVLPCKDSQLKSELICRNEASYFSCSKLKTRLQKMTIKNCVKRFY